MSSSPPGQYVQRIVAADREGHFFLDNGHGHSGMSPDDDPYRKLSFVGNGGTEILLPLDRVVESYPLPVPTSYVAALPGELVFLLGWWPLPEAPEPEILGRRWSLGNLAEDDSYFLLPQPESIQDFECRVIRNQGPDSIWIDSSIGFAVRRRELCDPATGALALRAEFSDFRHVGDGIDFPFSIRIEDFDYSAPASRDRQRRLNQINLQISDVRVNGRASIPQLKDRIPAGAIKRQGELDYELLVPGESEHLQSMAAWCRKQLSARPDLSPAQANASLLAAFRYLIIGIVAGCLLIWRKI